jgi:(p)ppGpp synthase/HD superfamily hydrolase
VQLSGRFDAALKLASDLHRAQLRKSSDIPYLAHLLAVAGLVLEHGGTEDEAIAGLLHDAVEARAGSPRWS